MELTGSRPVQKAPPYRYPSTGYSLAGAQGSVCVQITQSWQLQLLRLGLKKVIDQDHARNLSCSISTLIGVFGAFTTLLRIL